jgi:hypothetical protein
MSEVSTIRIGEDVFQMRYYSRDRKVRYEIETPTRKIVRERQPGSSTELAPERVVYDRRSMVGMIGLPGPTWPYQVLAALVLLSGMMLLIGGLVCFFRNRQVISNRATMKKPVSRS